MKLTTYISASVFIFMSAVVIRQNESNHHSSSLYETKWALRQVNTQKERMDVNGTAFIRFKEDEKSAGGNGGCNAFGISTVVNGNTIQFSNLVSTEMFCGEVQGQEHAFLSSLSKVTRYEIKGGILSLFNNKDLLLQFVSVAE